MLCWLFECINRRVVAYKKKPDVFFLFFSGNMPPKNKYFWSLAGSILPCTEGMWASSLLRIRRYVLKSEANFPSDHGDY